MKKQWYKQKTTWTGISGVVTGVAGFMTGTLDPASAIQTIIVSLMGVFMRQGIEGVKND